jgi:hypothetical protein
MANLKRRLQRLEGAQLGAPIIIVRPGETEEEAWQKYLAEHPEDEKAEIAIYIIYHKRAPGIC